MPLEPVVPAALVDDERHVGERLDVVDDGRLAVVAADGGVGRLGPRHAALALEGGDHRRLFAAHEGAGALADLDVERVAAAEDVVAEQAPFTSLVDGLADMTHGDRVLGPHVDEALGGLDGVGGDDHSFEDAVRVALEKGAVHERSRVAFVGVADQVAVVPWVLLADLPLQARREAAPAAAPQRARLDLLDDLVGSHGGQRLARRGINAALDGVVDPLGVDPADVAQHPLGLVGVEGDVLDMGHRGVAPVAEAPDDVAVHDGLGDHIRDVLDPVPSVHDVVRFDHRHRGHSAQAVAAGLDYVDLTDEPGRGDFAAEGRFHLTGPDCQTARGAHQYPAPSFGGRSKLVTQ